jgi:hypothetical protein
MSSQIRWLRISYWTGAIIDALACIPLLHSGTWAALNHVPDFHASVEFRYAQAFAAVFMAGWTVLLLWADRNPLERRGVLVITTFPVVIGLNSTHYLLYFGGLVSEPVTPLGIALPVVLTALFLFSYFNSFGDDAAGKKAENTV